MKMKFIVCALIAIAAFFVPDFSDAQILKDNVSPKVKSQLFFTETQQLAPEWLQVQVYESLPERGDFFVWIPTGDFATSALKRVPRFVDKKKFHNPTYVGENDLLKLSAVKGERVSSQIAIVAKNAIEGLHATVSDFKATDKKILGKDVAKTRFVGYVPVVESLIGFSYAAVSEGSAIDNGVSGDGYPNWVADPLMDLETIDVPAFQTQPIWFTFNIPQDANPGIYKGTIEIKSRDEKSIKIRVELDIKDYSIPAPKDYSFFTNIWLNPFAVSRYYDVDTWSDAHWKILNEYFDDQASHGQKGITATIVDRPWKVEWMGGMRSQTFDGFESMVGWTLDKEGQWSFDYSIFDTYVTTALSRGVGPYIYVYSLLNFRGAQRFTYWDEENNKLQVDELDVTDKRYKEIWTIFLKDFEKHLKEKNWLNQTYLAFDERPAKIMEVVYNVIKEAAPDFTNRLITYGSTDVAEYGKHFVLELNDFTKKDSSELARLCQLTDELIRKGKSVRTYVTCCGITSPNMFTFSPAVESYLIPLMVLEYGLDGFDQWAYNSWPEDVFTNPSFRYVQGDEYYVYPGDKGPMSSIRWELYKEGIETFELINKMIRDGRLNENYKKEISDLILKNYQSGRKELKNILKFEKRLYDKL